MPIHFGKSLSWMIAGSSRASRAAYSRSARFKTEVDMADSPFASQRQLALLLHVFDERLDYRRARSRASDFRCW
jgi:hypothetical protein